MLTDVLEVAGARVPMLWMLDEDAGPVDNIPRPPRAPALPSDRSMRAARSPQEPLGRRRQTLHRDAVVAENVGLGAGDRVLVGDTDDA